MRPTLPLPSITMRLPGRTRWTFTRVWAAPAVITPGRVLPGKATGSSLPPAATIVLPALTI